MAVSRRDAYVNAMRSRGLGAEIRVVVYNGEDQLDGGPPRRRPHHRPDVWC
ncbi:hypothetical protein [Kribbella sp. C-35]|uniref:hypothetical protein n=1 Tax=Kribbella sp. C-35 TaxID=2789276 RepID=UPI00397C9E09